MLVHPDEMVTSSYRLLTMTVLKWEIAPSSFGLLTMTVLKI